MRTIISNTTKDAAKEVRVVLPKVTSDVTLPGRTLVVRPGPRSYKERVVEGTAAALAEELVNSTDGDGGLLKVRRSSRRAKPPVIEHSDTEVSVGDEDSTMESEMVGKAEEKRRGPPATIGDFVVYAMKSPVKKPKLRGRGRNPPNPASPKPRTQGRCPEWEKSAQGETRADDSDTEISVGDDSTAEPEEPTTGQRGRPVTTGDYARLKIRKEEEAEQRRQQYLRGLEQDLLDPTPPKRKAWKECLKQEERDLEDLRECPTADILAGALEESVAIFKAANCSAGLKGTSVRRLYRSAARLRATTTVLGDRVRQAAPAEPKAAQEEVALLRREIEDLRLQVRNLKLEKAALQDPLAVPGPSGMEVDPAPEERATPMWKGEQMEVDVDFDNEIPPSPFTQPRTETAEEAKTRARNLRTRPPAPPTWREAPVENPPKALRPMLQGKQVPLRNYPAGLPAERRGAYDAVTRQIDSLLSERQRLMSHGPLTAPPASPQVPLSSSQTTAPAALPRPMAEEGEGPKRAKKKKGKEATRAPPSDKRPGKTPRPKVGAGGSKNESTRKRSTQQAPPKRVATIAPPPPRVQTDTTWTEVVSGRKKKAAAKAAKEATKPGGPTKAAPAAKKGAPVTRGAALDTKKAQKKKRRKVPRTAAISLHCPEGGYADAMRSVKANISLDELGIGVPHMRKGATGAFILEIAGEDCGQKADALAAKMSLVLADKEGVRVSRPQKKADLRLRDVDETVTETEVASAVASAGGCSAADVKVGPIKRFPNRMGTVWIQAPVAAANKISAAGKIKLGWCLARVELLDVRPLQCYRCLEKGHVQANCPGGPDRTGHCFRCGTPGHVARECTAPVRCPICADLGRKSDHKVGSKQCTPPRRKPAKGAATKTPALGGSKPPTAPAEEGRRKAAVPKAPPTNRRKQPSSSSKKRKLSEAPESQSDRDSERTEPQPKEQRAPRRITRAAATKKAEQLPEQITSTPTVEVTNRESMEIEMSGQSVPPTPRDTTVPVEETLEEPTITANNG